jgi:hypothetical protein
VGKNVLRTFLGFMTVLFAVSSSQGGPINNTATAAKLILQKNCAGCHANGKSQGGFGSVLDQNALVKQGLVVPKDPAGSLLYQKVATGKMPKNKPPLEPAELAIIRKWIEEGAEDWNTIPVTQSRTFISTDEMLALIANDIDRLEQENPRSLPFTRYLTLTHLHNSGSTEQELQRSRWAVNRLINSLSWGAEIVNPKPIDPARTILRIDLRDYRWSSATWERILQVNPYGVVYKEGKDRNIYSRNKTGMPHIRGDWFVAKASIPPLYHDILDLPNTSAKLEKQLRIDTTVNLAADQVVRAGFNKSGIAVNNRILERHSSDLTGGTYWRSYDFAELRASQNNSGTGAFRSFPERNIFSRPLGPAQAMPEVRSPFQHAAGEIIWSLPNGLHAYMIVNKDGNRIDSAPIEIVSDPYRQDHVVINGLSCMGCHSRGLIDKVDQVRSTVLQNRNVYSEEEVEHVLALYPEASRFATLLGQDRERFSKAVAKTGGPVEDSNPVVEVSLRFDADLDLQTAAAEIGLTSEQFTASLDRSPPELARELGPLRIPTGTIKRSVFIGLFGDVISGFELGQVTTSQTSLRQITSSLVPSFVPNEILTKSKPDAKRSASDQPIQTSSQQNRGGSAIRIQGTTLSNGAFQSK